MSALRRLRLALPWGVSLLLVLYLALTTDLERVWLAIRSVSLAPLVLVTVGGVVLGYLYDAWCLALALRRFNAPVSGRDVLPLKGASYLLNIVNYHAAAGGMALYLRRTRDVPFLEGASTFLFLDAADLLALAALVGAGLLTAGASVDEGLRQALLVTLAALAAGFVGAWLYWLKGWNFGVFGFLRAWRVFHAFRAARLVDYLWLAGLRVGLVVIYTAMVWLYLRLFGVHVPVGAMMALYPIVVLVWTIPVTVAGLGTAQIAIRCLFGGFAAVLLLSPPSLALAGGWLVPATGLAVPGLAAAPVAAVPLGAVAGALGAALDPTPAVDACSTTMIFATVLLRAAIGAVCLRGATRSYFRAAAAGARA